MTVRRRVLFALMCPFILNGCALFDSDSQRITGQYIVLWIDLPANQTVSKESKLYSSSSSLLVPAYVFAVGHNDRYVIAKQHPTNGFEGGYKVDTSKTNYYIVDMKNSDSIFGPLNKHAFDSLKTVRAIEQILFDRTYLDEP